MHCSNSKCQCEDGYQLNNPTKLCKKITFGSSCSNSFQCQYSDLNMLCSNGQYKCKDGYEYDYSTESCKKKKLIGSLCFNDYECPSLSTCKYNLCKCKLFYEPSYDLSYCKLKSCTYDFDCPGVNSYCSYGICSCKYGYMESTSTCVRDYSVDLNSYAYNYSSLNLLWILVIVPFIVFLIRFCIMYSRSSNRTSQVNVINRPANNANTISPGVPSVYNNPNPSSTVQLSCTQPPFDPPPKYDQVVSMNQ